MKMLSIRGGIDRILDKLSLCAVLQYAVYRFLQSTMFNFYYSNTYKLITMGLLLVFGGMRYIYIFIKKWSDTKGKQEKTRLIRHYLFVWLLALPFFYVGWLHDYKILIFLPICCMCLYNMEAEEICRWFFITIGICFAALILCSLSGTVRNLVIPWGRFTGSFGTINTTDFGSYFSFLALTYWCGMRSSKWDKSILFVAIVAITSYGAWYYSGSKTTLYTAVLIVFFVLWVALYENELKKKKRIKDIARRINWLSILAFPTISILTIILVSQYAAQAPWAYQIDDILTGRLNTIIKPYEKYGINAFGNAIETMHGVGATSVPFDSWSSGYGYLDVAYAMLAIRYGWVITAIVGCMWVWTTVRAIRNGKIKFALAMVILAVHGFSEARVLDINYNIFLVMPFCAFEFSQKQEKKTEKKAYWIPIVSGALILIGGYLLLPRILSWLRTFYYLKKWNEGTAAFGSFVTNICILLLVWALWKSPFLFSNRKKIKGLLVATVFLLLLGGTVYINNTIEKGRKEQTTRLQMEEQIIKTAQANAVLPIYAAESEEMYRRDGLEIPFHIFSSEELKRGRGSIVVDNKIESFGITRSGGVYTQISDYSGIYSFDSSLIEILADNEWNNYFTGRRSINIKDMALFNGLPITNVLEIRDGQRVRTSNAETDQFSGTYKVCFLFSGLKTKADGEVVLLEIIGEAGENCIHQEILTDANFDESGQCEYTITYQVMDTPKVSYAISVMDGVTVTIEDIIWWRES